MVETVTRQVICAVSWRRQGRAAKEYGDEIQVEEFQLGVEVVEEAPDAPYESYVYDPWTEARRRIVELHNTIQNHVQVVSIEPVCSCLGPCRYPQRTRFLVEPTGFQHFPSALFDRDDANDDMGWRPIAAGSEQDMELLLERHRRSNHHQ